MRKPQDSMQVGLDGVIKDVGGRTFPGSAEAPVEHYPADVVLIEEAVACAASRPRTSRDVNYSSAGAAF